MLYGYAGKILFVDLIVDLTDGTLEEEAVTEELARNFIGGYGFGARILYNRMKPGIDPLGSDSILGFTAGPLKGITIDYKLMAAQFCEKVGWDKESMIPNRESLMEIGGMEDVIKDIYG